MDTQGDRPPSEFEPPSRFGPGKEGTPTGDGPITRADRMRAQIADLTEKAEAARAEAERLSRPGPDETPTADKFGAVSDADRIAANNARAERLRALAEAQNEARTLESRAQAIATDLANDPDAGAAAAAKPKRVNVPTINLGPRRPGQRTDLDALEAGWNTQIAAWEADTSLTNEQVNARIQKLLTDEVFPAAQ